MERDILADVNHPYIVKLHYGKNILHRNSYFLVLLFIIIGKNILHGNSYFLVLLFIIIGKNILHGNSNFLVLLSIAVLVVFMVNESFFR